ncbi:hypothetical protein [Bradyrhizobium sp. DOA9]|uniref:hypothetical protein n=1 Tax=Bradyrhizobium sp. DOA9 TaxID=1126627 RepID=UPI00046A9B4D|nr:hypothetical protein [Bradyrhizobium sp. DOA9]GAJ35915.1 hypothetical protein BDOA9_0151250 [Bradyrhizobium sp. DOA9]
MTASRLLSMGLIAAALLGGPVMAREHHRVAQQPEVTADTVAATTPFHYPGERACVPAPRVGAFATPPWTGNNVPCEPGTGSY